MQRLRGGIEAGQAVGEDAQRLAIIGSPGGNRGDGASHFGDAHRLRHVGRVFLVDDLTIDTHEAAIEFLGQARTELAAVNSIEACMPDVAANLIVAAQVEIEIIGKAGAIFGIHARVLIVHALHELDAAAFGLPRLVDEVDDGAVAVGRERRSTATAHRFNTGERGIHLHKTVSRRKVVIAEQKHGQAIFLKRDELRTTGDGGKAADLHVGVAAAGRRLSADAGQTTEDFSRAARRDIGHAFDVQGTDRDAGVEAVGCLGNTRHNDFSDAGVGFV